ncbi:FAD-binding oxidoreductase [Lapillicoccus jejuensis]|uniref:FAD-binding oxidoreductase n=2 Tax=Lapillicoccus jejuensis TaxID=402171 RepID=UPI001FE39FE4|nr:FAD-binding oxidoreductase [Lapillicoccus jejuensis]
MPHARLATPAEHASATREVRAQYASLPQDAPVRLAKRTSNLFRPRAAAVGPGLDVGAFDRAIDVDPVSLTARVQGMTTYEHLVEATLAQGCTPLVVPQLKTITLGGAVTGLGIESTSFRNGLPHESVLEAEVLTGDGEVVTATPDGEHADLFRSFPNSYGSLGYALSLTIEVERVHPYVALRHVPFHDLSAVTDAIAAIMRERRWDGEPVDFLDGVVFSRDEAYLTLGRWADSLDEHPDGPGTRPSDYTGQQVFYRSLQQRERDLLTVRDYLWRWDTDWFWCSRAFGAQHPLVRRLWPKSRLRSDVYWKIVAFENRHKVMARLDERRGRPARERVVQDVEIPLSRTAEFLDWFLREVPVEPLWLCPVQLRPDPLRGGEAPVTGSSPWPLYPMEVGTPYVNVGFWSTVPILPGRRDGDTNRAIEDQVHELGGHKSLYSDAYYDEETFAALYGGADYALVKKRYDPRGRLPSLYDKAVRAR